MDKSSILASIAGMCGSMGAVAGKLAFDSELDSYAKASCIAVFIASNVAMWATYTRSLALSSCTTTPMIINVASNFALTGVLGSLLFSESHSFLWWAFLALLVSGLTLMLAPDRGEQEKED